MSDDNFSLRDLHLQGNCFVQRPDLVISTSAPSTNKKPKRTTTNRCNQKKRKQKPTKTKVSSSSNATKKKPTKVSAKPSRLTRSRRSNKVKKTGFFKSATVRFTRKPLVRSLQKSPKTKSNGLPDICF